MAIKLVVIMMAIFIGKISMETAMAEKVPEHHRAPASIDENYNSFKR